MPAGLRQVPCAGAGAGVGSGAGPGFGANTVADAAGFAAGGGAAAATGGGAGFAGASSIVNDAASFSGIVTVFSAASNPGAVARTARRLDRVTPARVGQPNRPDTGWKAGDRRRSDGAIDPRRFSAIGSTNTSSRRRRAATYAGDACASTSRRLRVAVRVESMAAATPSPWRPPPAVSPRRRERP